jgi:hypothetical protein
MKPSPEQHRLLADVLGEETGFREALLGETLRLARRRRHWRQVWHGLAGLAALALVVMGGWWARQPKTLNVVSTIACPVVCTQPLRPEEIVSTRPLMSDLRIASAATVPIVSTVLGSYREIGDDELLALAAPRVAALVRHGPHEAELIFVPPEASASETN